MMVLHHKEEKRRCVLESSTVRSRMNAVQNGDPDVGLDRVTRGYDDHENWQSPVTTP